MGPSIRTSGGTRSARAFILAHNVVSPQNNGGVSAAATDANILAGVLHPPRIAARARHSSRPRPLVGSGCSWIHFQDTLLVQERENMYEHGLIKKTSIEPQNDTLVDCHIRRLPVLAVQCFQNAPPVQPACGDFFQKQRVR